MKKVKLLNSKENRGMRRLKAHIGRTFRVRRESADFYHIDKLGQVPGEGWYKRRFRVVDENISETLDEILGLDSDGQ